MNLSKRQRTVINHLMRRFNMSRKAALVELKYRDDFKKRRNQKLLEIFGKGKNFDEFIDPPEVIIE